MIPGTGPSLVLSLDPDKRKVPKEIVSIGKPIPGNHLNQQCFEDAMTPQGKKTVMVNLDRPAYGLLQDAQKSN